MIDGIIFPLRGKSCNVPEARPVKQGKIIAVVDTDPDPIGPIDMMLYQTLQLFTNAGKGKDNA